ncbi:MAG: CapA family protein [Prevotella sp.]|nr:CapA family protein [Prevotella sp.]
MLRFVGDINLTDWDFNPGFGIGSQIAQGFDPFSKIKRSKSDIWIGNFEGVTSEVTNRAGMAAKVFRVSPSSLMKLHHFDYYGLANNHAMQHGVEAYLQTWNILQKQGCKVFGKKDCRTISFTHQGKIVTLTGCCFRIDEFATDPCYWYNPEYKDIEKEVSILPSDAIKVFFVHWGNEFINRPSSGQKKFAHWLIDAGFDLIIGMHPHILQGFEMYAGKYIFYSLGNFVFDMAWEPTHYGAIVNVDLAKEEPLVTYDYIRIGNDCSPIVVHETEVPRQIRFDSLNQLVSIDDNSEEYHTEIIRKYKQYRRANHKDLFKKLLHHPLASAGIIQDFIKRKF